MTRAVALEVGVGGTNDDEVNGEVVLSEKEEVELGCSSGSEVGSSAGRLGVGSTVGGREGLVAPSGGVVLMPGGGGVSVGLELDIPGVEGPMFEGPEAEEPDVVVVVEGVENGGGGGGRMEVGVSVGTLDSEELKLEGGGSTIVEPPEVKVELPVEGSGTTIVEPPEVEALGVTEGGMMIAELPEDEGSGTIIVEPPSVGEGRKVIVEPLEVEGGDGGMGVRVPVGIDDGEPVGIGDCGTDEELGIGGSEIEGLGVGDPGGVVLLDSEKLLVLEVILEPAVVDNDGLEVELVRDAVGRLGVIEGNELDKLGLNVMELTDVEPADVEEADDEPAGGVPAEVVLADGEPEIDELDWARLELGAVGLLDDDEETVADELVTVVLGIKKLLVDVPVPGGLLGGKGTEATAEVLLEPVGETELDMVVSVEDQALDVWLDMVADKLELCPVGIMIVVDEDSTVDADEGWELLLLPLVGLKTVELPCCVEGAAGGADVLGGEVSVEEPALGGE